MTSNDKNEFKICLGIFKRGWEELISTHIYFVCIAAVPIFFSMFFTVMMHNGVPERLPVGIVDQDRSQTSRSIIRTLNSMSAVEAEYYYESFYAANEAIKENKIYAFMEIPEDFERLLYDNKQPEIGFFTNEAYYIAGLFSYKALKLTGHLVNGNIKIKSLSAKGTYPETIQTTIQPIICDLNLLGNPWVNYSYYLSSVFLPAALQLMILLTTVYTLGIKIKRQTSRRELVMANGSIFNLVFFSLLPQTILFTIVGWGMNYYLWGYLKFPLNCPIIQMLIATFLLVVACQSIGVFMISLLPILRLGLSSASLFGVVAFSITGFSLPSLAMYGPLRAFCQIYPIRHYFMIYSTQALNGLPVWYSLNHYLYLSLFILVGIPLLPKLKKALFQQVYKL